jgi:hypothetical protein
MNKNDAQTVHSLNMMGWGQKHCFDSEYPEKQPAYSLLRYQWIRRERKTEC